MIIFFFFRFHNLQIVAIGYLAGTSITGMHCLLMRLPMAHFVLSSSVSSSSILVGSFAKETTNTVLQESLLA